MSYKPNTYTTTLTGMLHKLKMIHKITENVANANTVSYKRQYPESISFKSILSDIALRDGSQGQFNKTNNIFDLAIEGNAYFLIDSLDGPVPTKVGKFELNEKGDLVTLEGKEVIVVEKTEKLFSLATSNDIHINEHGEIFVGNERYGRIAMQILDNNPVRIHQGYLEGSNVNIMSEMMSLSMAFRAFEASEKTLGMELSVDKDLIEKYGRNV